MMDNQFSSVPPEIVRYILTYCSLEDALRLSFTCKRFQSIIHDAEKYWAAIAIPLWEHTTQSPKSLLIWAKDTNLTDITWKSIAECLSNPSGVGYGHKLSLSKRVISIGFFHKKKMVHKDSFRINLASEYLQRGDFLTDGNGYGVTYWKSGNRYHGNYKDFKKDGFGDHYWPDGKKYSGLWNNGKKQGEGTLSWQNGVKCCGNFRNGKMNGPVFFNWPDGFSYSGTMLDNTLQAPEQCLHPKIGECIDERRCTSIVSEMSAVPQILYTCSKCMTSICQSCVWNECHSCADAQMKPGWQQSSNCNCTNQQCTRRN
eukprot:TRINITY_DN2697_c0_g1_i1.p1 TRINITY_DN2697_c0_g1~~TRINITY_DN2697_c0_g1_i1.p1  ORF type:complete len:369 (-),score=50.55 TRINITY_DN2697_c0_g1_i1:105-1046(-)